LYTFISVLKIHSKTPFTKVGAKKPQNLPPLGACELHLIQPSLCPPY